MSLMRQLYEENGVQRGFCAMCDHPITHPIGKRKLCRSPGCHRAYQLEYGARRYDAEKAQRLVDRQLAGLRRTINRIERSLST